MADDGNHKSNEPQIGRGTRIVCLLLVAAYLVWIFASSRFEGSDTSGQVSFTHHQIAIRPMHDSRNAFPLSRPTRSIHTV